MLTLLEFKTKLNKTLVKMPFSSPINANPFLITDSSGLDPVEANIITTPYASIDGDIYQHSTVGTRNIVLTLSILTNPQTGFDVSEHRETLYRLLPPKSFVILVFHKKNVSSGSTEYYRIKAYVESIETPIFSSSSEVQISLLCPEPYFSENSGITIQGTTGVPMDTTRFGSAPSGFIFEISLPENLTTSVSDIYIETGLEEPLFYGKSLLAKDKLKISTVERNKYVQLTRGGVTTNELKGITKGTMAVTVDSRTPTFYVNKTTSTTDPLPFTIRLTPRHVGL